MKGSAQKFLNNAIGNNAKPRLINIDKSGANNEGIRTFNKRNFKNIRWRHCKYLNNIVEHRNIKRRIAINTGFKELESALRTLTGIETMLISKSRNSIRPISLNNCYNKYHKKELDLKLKGQTFRTFYSLAV